MVTCITKICRLVRRYGEASCKMMDFSGGCDLCEEACPVKQGGDDGFEEVDFVNNENNGSLNVEIGSMGQFEPADVVVEMGEEVNEYFESF